MKEYKFSEIESKWQKEWEEQKIFKTENKDENRENYYLLEMFPYPSGKIHMGHVRNYSIGDVIARYKKMNGYNVLHPIGWDSFGLPAENAAIQNGVDPKKWTLENIESMKKQLKKLGFSYDWDREIATCKEDYYKWNQWIFTKLYEKGLVYKKKSYVNWCDSCKTVLANEQVEDGKCWRCGNEVHQKDLEQWFFKITDYAEELLEGHKELKGNWPDKVIAMQKNWIGKSYGTEVNFKLENSDIDVPVFTTRVDTIFGVTYMVLAPEHPLVEEILKENKDIKEKVYKMRNEDKISRTAENSEKTGVFSGKYVINPVNNEKVPLWIGNYVLMDYGTGAVMAVPTHDERDFQFAKKYNLKLKIVITPEEDEINKDEMTEAYIKKGILINSGEFNGLKNREAISKIADYIEKKGYGKKTTNYRLKDWLISRQRYWGTPIPAIYCEKCGVVMEKEENLPVRLPSDVEFTGTGNPLETSNEYKNVVCPKCGGKARRETDTMDTFVDSSWYYLRYTDSKNSSIPFEKEIVDGWVPVDQYIGGIEHAVMHLLYSRFFHKLLRDLGLLSSDEPFKKLLTQGMVLGPSYHCPDCKKYYYASEVEEGNRCKTCGKDLKIKVEKMSKSKNNGVDPNHIIAEYGADTARLFTLFAAPPEKELEWNEKSLAGAFRFLNRVWRIVLENKEHVNIGNKIEIDVKKLNKDDKNLMKKLNQTIKKVTESMEDNFHFNTAIAAIMELVNEMYLYKNSIFDNKKESNIWREVIEKLVILVSPFVPHIADELWEEAGFKGFVYEEKWPISNEEFLVEDEVNVAFQVNGKLRDAATVAKEIGREELKELALNSDKVKKYTDGKNILKVIVVPNKIVNIVVK
ncbi:leucine--tRNA ligase [Haliovirga abyssi]|uniref:Leucine--tRNA ligase n=1 Tax=Haliovirga abyssi TaxID=2996794 RepID=A0AAU9DBL9_9FUSO|nr:leucine--tRNA ligase [Haliovirga abyssi]BDU49652.1 leucine--tRNA ligase [Haliovirga abyssi]